MACPGSASAGSWQVIGTTFERLLAAKEQVVICGATLDEAIAARVLAARDRDPPRDPRRCRRSAADRARLDGGPVGVRVDRAARRGRRVWSASRPDVPFEASKFHHTLLHEHGTYVGAGHWFELDDRYFRLGFGWPTHDELRAGLDALSAA